MAALSDIDGKELLKLRFLVDEACEFVESRCKKSDPTPTEQGRLETLCAVYALRLVELSNDENITSFTAGDIKLSSPADSGRYDKLWGELVSRSADLITQDNYIFGRVI